MPTGHQIDSVQNISILTESSTGQDSLTKILTTMLLLLKIACFLAAEAPGQTLCMISLSLSVKDTDMFCWGDHLPSDMELC